MATATGEIQITSWNEEPYWEGDDGRKLTQARVAQTYSGDVAGAGAVDYLMSYGSDGTARFVGLTRVEGALAGRDGSFVVESVGEFDGSRAAGSWSVLPGSATGGLTGLRGEGAYDAPMGSTASITLDYRFE
jgi:hypothetical protein